GAGAAAPVTPSLDLTIVNGRCQPARRCGRPCPEPSTLPAPRRTTGGGECHPERCRRYPSGIRRWLFGAAAGIRVGRAATGRAVRLAHGAGGGTGLGNRGPPVDPGEGGEPDAPGERPGGRDGKGRRAVRGAGLMPGGRDTVATPDHREPDDRGDPRVARLR